LDDSDDGAPPSKLSRNAHSAGCGITEQNGRAFSHYNGLATAGARAWTIEAERRIPQEG
jgi:hypothetical protein